MSGQHPDENQHNGQGERQEFSQSETTTAAKWNPVLKKVHMWEVHYDQPKLLQFITEQLHIANWSLNDPVDKKCPVYNHWAVVQMAASYNRFVIRIRQTSKSIILNYAVCVADRIVKSVLLEGKVIFECVKQDAAIAWLILFGWFWSL